MKVVEKANATGSLADYTDEVHDGPVVVTSQGQPVAVLIQIENADLETVALSNNKQFLELIERSRLRARTEGTISGEEMRRRLGIKPRK